MSNHDPVDGPIDPATDAHAPRPAGSHTADPPAGRAAGLPEVDTREHGGRLGGEPQRLDRRLFMQLLVFHTRPETDVSVSANALINALSTLNIAGVVYDDVNDPRGLGLLTWSEDPTFFVTRVRPLLLDQAFRGLVLRPEYTMLGRTYGTGHEPRLEHALLERPRETVSNPAWPWAIWYPLRRSGAFSRLDPHEQASVLREHASIGMAYGQRDLAHDVRLACHGLDARDNEFVVGLIGRELHPLSHCVQAMRKTRQTAEFIAQMGPFFVGYARARTAPSALR